MTTTTLSLQHFYPAELEITEILETTDKIIINLKSHMHSCKCPSCGTLSTQYHATYLRRVQDLPILGKNTELHIRVYEYQCENPDCPVTTLAESFGGFLNFYSRMTERLSVFSASWRWSPAVKDVHGYVRQWESESAEKRSAVL